MWTVSAAFPAFTGEFGAHRNHSGGSMLTNFPGVCGHSSKPRSLRSTSTTPATPRPVLASTTPGSGRSTAAVSKPARKCRCASRAGHKMRKAFYPGLSSGILLCAKMIHQSREPSTRITKITMVLGRFSLRLYVPITILLRHSRNSTTFSEKTGTD
jgi:hypothetical protein